MFNKKLITAVASLALVAAPTVAAAQSAPAPVAPASETVEGNELRGGFILPLAVIALLIAGYFLFIEDGDEDPISP